MAPTAKMMLEESYATCVALHFGTHIQLREGRTRITVYALSP
jgi:hypothetical protein